MENWLVIVVGIYLVGMILYGHYKGFIRLAVSLVALMAAFVIVNAAMPTVSKYLKEHDTVYQVLENSMRKAVGVGEDEEIEVESPSQQRIVIEGLNLPEQIKQSLLENNNSEVYSLLGVEKFVDYVTKFLADRIINTAAFLILFFVVLFVIHILMRWLDIIAMLPILSGLNKIAGAILGGVEALVILWVLCLVVTVFSSTHIGMEIMNQIASSQWLSFLYNNNLLTMMFLSAIQGLI